MSDEDAREALKGMLGIGGSTETQYLDLVQGEDVGEGVGVITPHQGGVRSSINKIWNPLIELNCCRALSANQLRKKRYAFL
eukprot:4419051-Ditylum_brightwellii.AAC.1